MIDFLSSLRMVEWAARALMHAVAGKNLDERALYYYIKDVPRLLETRQQIMEYVLVASGDSGVGLATPVLYSRTADAAPASDSAIAPRPSPVRETEDTA
ncbi:MAG: hypothetical protein ACR2RL_21955 [Gammaproteobacteria bacterium]